MSAPTSRTILWRDFLASALARVGLGIWGFVILFELMGRLGGAQAAAIHRYGSANLWMLALGMSTLALPLLLWRISVIRRVLLEGRPLQAKVVQCQEQQTMCAVWVEYVLEGETYQRRNAVRHGGPRRLQIGQQVTVMVAPNAPHVGFVRELYEDS
ncbi:MAG: hypothetical protein EA397_18630 [Deltaproteobacteria bacterium]|nr:MAG: hypothetical protein EA397_18630 [Deltaproteobacteria bacterium]